MDGTHPPNKQKPPPKSLHVRLSLTHGTTVRKLEALRLLYQLFTLLHKQTSSHIQGADAEGERLRDEEKKEAFPPFFHSFSFFTRI